MSKEVRERLIRSYNVQLEEGEGKRSLTGFIPFNQRSEYMGFYEYITPTAFNKTLSDGADVLALFAHDTSKVLGRTKNGSLRLEVREDGLYCYCDLPDTSYAKDCFELIRSGYSPNMSFGFSEIKTDYSVENGVETHFLREVKLYEVSFGVAMPAYQGTDSFVRGIDISVLANTLGKENLEENDFVQIQSIIDNLQSLLPTQPAEEETITEVVEENTSADESDEQLLERLLEGLKEIKGEI